MEFVHPEVGQTLDISGEANGLKISVAGNRTPMVQIELPAGLGVTCAATAIMQRDAAISMQDGPNLAKSMHLMINRNETEPAGITLTTGCTGLAGVFDLKKHHGRLLCPLEGLLAVGPGVMATVYSRVRYTGPDRLDIMRLEGHGWVILRACGDIKHIRLNPGKQAIVNTMAIAALSATIDFDPLAPEDGQNFVQLTGPGQVWLQSGSYPR